MASLRIGQAADLLGVSVDTVRRLVDSGAVEGGRSDGGQRFVDGVSLAAYLVDHAEAPSGGSAPTRTARNRFTGLVTQVRVEGLVAQVELQAGPHRIVSLITAEAVEDLHIVPGMVATASVKATSVVVEVPEA
ncbi:TOBE domain-containing protein [Aquihabitans sp. McL0605]|uniref:TOBE domain-containing protein n=1 Tax=Aquihabitans sp. McL0605 TaxID=3415671 RepID=UPI003CEA5011